jgi:glycosyltransferase involved in cell wall biosynthesis
MDDRPLRILLASPAYWPARAFGGPVVAAREIVRRLVGRGHRVDVVTTTLLEVDASPARRTWVDEVDGATVHHLGTPLRYRWMGVPPSLPSALRGLSRPDVVHVHGFRDPVTTWTSGWAGRAGIPTVFEPLGMFRARLRKVALKRALDRALFDRVALRARSVVTVSLLEADDVVARGIARERVVVRGLGFPDPDSAPPTDGSLRRGLGIPLDAPLALYVGRIASGKGIGHLVAAARAHPALHVALVGPDDRHGALAGLDQALADPVLGGRVHRLGPTAEPPLALMGEATVFVLASAGDSFGLSAAEAAAAGTPLIVTDRCGIAGFLRDGEALVVPDEQRAVVEAIGSVIADRDLARRLGDGGRAAARRMSWEHVVDVQEAVYREVASSTASTNASTLGS